MIFQAILDPSFEILYDYLPPSSRANADSMPTFHRFFRGFNTFPNDRVLHRKQGADEALGERTMAALLNQQIFIIKRSRVPARNGGDRCWPRITARRADCLYVGQYGIIQGNIFVFPLFGIMLPKPWHKIGFYFVARVFEKAEVFLSNWPKVWLNARVKGTHEHLRWLLRFAKIFHDVCGFTGTWYRGLRYWWFRLEELGYWGDGKIRARRRLEQRVRDEGNLRTN